MPAEQRGEPYRLAKGRWGLRYRDRDGVRKRTKEKFPSKTAAYRHYRDVVEPMLRGETPRREHTLAELVELYLDRHAATVRRRTIAELRKRLRYAASAFGDVPLRDLERMGGEIAAWRTQLPERSRYGVTQALRQTLEDTIQWLRAGAAGEQRV